MKLKYRLSKSLSHEHVVYENLSFALCRYLWSVKYYYYFFSIMPSIRYDFYSKYNLPYSILMSEIL
jgi:hypothetical protein